MLAQLSPLVLLALIGASARAQEADWQRRKEEAARYFAEALNPRSQEAPAAAGEPANPREEEPSLDPEAFRRLVVALFDAYEREDAGGFVALLGSGFSAADRSGNDYRAADMARALSDDFACLDAIRFTVFVGQPLVQRDGSKVQVEARWSRRAMIEVGGQEWLLTDQVSTFMFERGPRDEFLLARIFGDAIFGLAGRTGQILVREGTIDGEPVRELVVIDRTAGLLATGAAPGASPAASTVSTFGVTFQGGNIDFETQSWVPYPGAGPAGYDIMLDPLVKDLSTANGALFQELAPGSIDALASVPAGGYVPSPAIALNGSNADVGRLFAIQTSTGKYAAFEITDYDVPTFVYTLKCKYQSSGSRDLR